MASPTPGPWFVGRMYEGSRTVAILRDWKGPNVALAVHGPQNWIHAADATEHIEANAHLIAAAPELLAALKRAVDTIHAWHDMTGNLSEDDKATAWRIYRTHAPEMKAINAAIAKAEGR
jgi:hypothetical protein